MSKFWENSKGRTFHWIGQGRKPKSWSEEEDAKFYHTTAWRKCRAAYVASHPICVMCEAHGQLVPVQVVDHIIPIRAGGEKFDWNNLQSLCHKCHNHKTAKEKHEYSQNDI